MLACSACGTTRFTVSRRVPGEVDIAPGKPIAVAAIQGEAGDQLAAELTAALAATRHFQVLERQHLAGALREIKFSAEGHVSDETAMSFGQMTGAAMLVVGSVTTADYREDVRSEEQQCPKKDGGLRPCLNYTRTAGGSLRVVLDLIETESGKVLAAKVLSADQSRMAQAIDGAPPPLAARDELLQACRGEVLRRFIAAVAPHEEDTQVVLRTDGDLPELDAGTHYALVKDWTAAVEQYRMAVARADGGNLKPSLRALAHYDLGVGLAYSGNFDEGRTEVERAYALDPDDLYREQIRTIARFKEEARRVATQDGR